MRAAGVAQRKLDLVMAESSRPDFYLRLRCAAWGHKNGDAQLQGHHHPVGRRCGGHFSDENPVRAFYSAWKIFHQAYAHDLYAHLRALDRSACTRILVEAVPEDERWDAVRDRLSRAAAASESESAADDDSRALNVLP